MVIQLKDFVWLPEAFNKINGFIQRFHILPFDCENGPEVQEHVEVAQSGDYDFSRSICSLVTNYQTDFLQTNLSIVILTTAYARLKTVLCVPEKGCKVATTVRSIAPL